MIQFTDNKSNTQRSKITYLGDTQKIAELGFTCRQTAQLQRLVSAHSTQPRYRVHSKSLNLKCARPGLRAFVYLTDPPFRPMRGVLHWAEEETKVQKGRRTRPGTQRMAEQHAE